jgi:hypothetical protein
MSKTIFFAEKSLLAFCLICSAMSACRSAEKPGTAPLPAFYHWKTQMRLVAAEQNYLQALHVQKLYVKFFDLDWDEAAGQSVPLATVEMDTAGLAGLDIVPTVFITNRCLLNLPMQEVDTLASRIYQKIKFLALHAPNELQFDCDWTPQTQAKYFGLLNSVKNLSQLDSSFTRPHHSAPLISATIRLHQLKYPEKTGVPPVDRGMLMCYNMGDLDDWATENSILDTAILKSYLSPTPDYPLPLDLALPLFRWGVLFRDGRLAKLLNGLSDADMQDTARFAKTAPNRYEVKKSTYLQAHYLYAGDQIRLEAVSDETLAAAAKQVALLRSETRQTVAFYHLDTTAVQLFPKEKILETLGHWVHQ